MRGQGLSRSKGTQNVILSNNKNDKKENLSYYEETLDAAVSPKFLVDPTRFRSLDTIIEVLEHQLSFNHHNPSTAAADKNNVQSKHHQLLREDEDLRKKLLSRMGQNTLNLDKHGGKSYDQMWHYTDGNAVYTDLQHQHAVVERAIEYMVVHHVEELNKDLGKVADVSRDFQESIGRVRALRKRVQGIQGRLGNGHAATTTTTNTNTHNSNATAKSTTAHGDNSAVTVGAAKSLRELWLKKLECEAVLSLLRKIEIIREAPIRFDQLVPPIARHCRIGAATVLLAEATDTLFLTSGVEALAKVSSQFMIRKEKALKIIWETMNEVLHLKNGGPMIRYVKDVERQDAYSVSAKHSKRPTSEEIDADNDEHVDETEVLELCFSENPTEFVTKKYAIIDVSSRIFKDSRMISVSVLDSVLKLESDELRIIDMSITSDERMQRVARYTDSTMALRILVDSLKVLNSLEDVERTLSENLRLEIRKVSERVQDNTFSWIDQRRAENKRLGKVEAKNRDSSNFLSRLPKELQRHFFMMLLSYENVLLRYCHLAQIIRQKMKTDPELINKVESHEQFFTLLQPTIILAEKLVQEEIKSFLKACLNVADTSAASSFLFSVRSTRDSKQRSKETMPLESGFFSLGIIDENEVDSNKYAMQKEMNRSNMSNSGVSLKADVDQDKFVSILLSDIGVSPDIRHALLFRPFLSKWSKSVTGLKTELALFTGGENESPQQSIDESALEFLDLVIERQLLPLLQSDAMDGTIAALERSDAFSPILSNSLYLRSTTDQGHVELCRAAQAFLDSTTPLFAALHQLPKSGENLSPLVAVMEHATLTFVSRAKQRIRELCNGKTADALLGGGEGGNGGKKETTFASLIKEKPEFKAMMNHYGYGERVSERKFGSSESKLIPTLQPSSSDTKARHNSNDQRSESSVKETGFYEEVQHVESLLCFSKHGFGRALTVSTEEELYYCASIAHSLLKLSEELDKGLHSKNKSRNKTLSANRALRSAIGTIRVLGRRMALFCRVNVLVQTIKYMAKLCSSDVLVSEDGARVATCVNDLGEYLAAASDNIHETAGSVVAGYALSSLEEYLPLLLIRVIEILGTREGLPPWYGPTPFKVTSYGVESLERCCNTLQRDLKSVAQFEGSFWNEEIYIESFKRASSYISLLELDGDELLAYMRANWGEFDETECRGMFAVNAPRRKGNAKAFDVLKEQMKGLKSVK